MKRTISLPVVNYSKVRKSQTVPDQSMSIKEIVSRYVRGIPVDVVKREGVFVDQHEHDLEKLSRMDFGEKAAYAQHLAEQARSIANDLRERSEAQATKEREQKEAQAKQAEPPQTPPKGA